jgi:hypothetical protein
MVRLLILCLLISNFAFSQFNPDARRDYSWVFGYESAPPNYGRSIIDFNTTPSSVHYNSAGLNIYITNASISDENGNLLFYTNGMYVADCTHTIMPHGDSINYGYFYNSMNNTGLGYFLNQGSIILPSPDDEKEFFIIHSKIVPDVNYYAYQRVEGLYYTTINMLLNNGLGDVYEGQKNVPIILDTLDYGYISAVRHGNGRDWWIIVRELSQNCFYRVLLSPAGFTNYGLQCIGNSDKHPTPQGQVLFSQDGSVFVRCSDTSFPTPTVVEIYSFDRCSGEFSNYKSFSIANTSMWVGLALSPSSQFLYYSNQSYVYQYDLWADSVFATEQIIGIYDTFVSQFNMPVTYNQQLLGPDGIIYIEGGATNYFSTISNPDSPGTLCNFQAHSFEIPAQNAYSMPNFPNFRLGKLAGSICDSLIVGIRLPEDHGRMIEVFPNPASERVTISLNYEQNSNSLTLDIINHLSEIVMERKLSPFQGILNLDISNLTAGIYYVLLYNNGKIIGTCKLIARH